MAGLLSMTFRGPFVFLFPTDPTKYVDVFAPRCDGHTAGVFWTDGSLPIHGLAQQGHNHIHTISGGVTSHAGAITKLGGPLCPPIGAPPPAPNPARHAHFHLVVPRPKIVYGMNQDQVEIVGVDGMTSPQGLLQYYATGIRFYYDWTVGTPISLQCPAYPYPPAASTHFPPPLPITPPAGTPLPDYGDIEIKFDGPNSGDPDHLDATSCFSKIAELAGVPWWLNHYDNSGGGAAVRTGTDCTAPPLVFGI